MSARHALRAAGATLALLNDGREHFIGELIGPGETMYAITRRMKRLAKRGLAREVAPQVWQIAGKPLAPAVAEGMAGP